MHKALSHTTWLLAALLGLLAGACGRHQAASPATMRADSLNSLAYRYHYQDIDTVRRYASEAYHLADSCHYAAGKAEALNHLAFERFQQMDFDSAQVIARSIGEVTDDEIECLVAEVMLMKIAQRTSDNLAFFRHRSHALKRIRALERSEYKMEERRKRRFDFARGDMHIVASTYFFYLDQQERATAEIRMAEPFCRLPEDTAQWLYYNYMRGSGGLSDNSDPQAIAREEFNYLLPCFWMARREGYVFFEANAEQSLATLFSDTLRLMAVAATQPEIVAMLAQVFDNGDSSPSQGRRPATDNLFSPTFASAMAGKTQYNAKDEVDDSATDPTDKALVSDPRRTVTAAFSFDPQQTAMNMAEAAYEHFLSFDDLYQQACALRTLGELSFESGRYTDAVSFYAQALDCVNFHHLCYYSPETILAATLTTGGDMTAAERMAPSILLPYDPASTTSESVERQWMRSSDVKTVPEWIAGIRQHLSVAFSALDMKAESDYNRNIYLDLLDVTREDAELESRVAELEAESRKLAWTWGAVAMVALLIVGFVLYLMYNWRKRTQANNRLLDLKIQQIRAAAQQQQAVMEEEQELLRDQQKATELRLLRDKQQNVEKRAKLQLVAGIQPYLNRIIHEVQRMQKRGETTLAGLDYISELTERINEYNNLLTEWIQMQKGQLSLQLSTFPLEPLFNTIRRSHYAYDLKGLNLEVTPTTLSVKADRSLTLFMINTLADNARKFTPKDGRITISATDGNDENGLFVEISVTDTGCGIAEEDVRLILDNKVYDAAKIGSGAMPATDAQEKQKGFGFGLMNCKGIIEKYRKTAPLFAVCKFGIESRIGQGSRFWFRLPRVATLLMALLISGLTQASTSPLLAQQSALTPEYHNSIVKEQLDTTLVAVYQLADSVYFCNLAQRYHEAIFYADSAFHLWNEYYSGDTLINISQLYLYQENNNSPELDLWRRQTKVDYSLILGLRNEIAVAALALHDWPLYRYNNRVYTRLYKLSNQDATLESYCLRTERSQQNERWAIFAMTVIFFLGAGAFVFLYIWPRIRFRRKMTQLNAERLVQLQRKEEAEQERRQNDLEMAEDEHRRRLYEENRLHVQNLIIDNTLSTIKHETIYYPGRIQQLVDRLRVMHASPSSSSAAEQPHSASSSSPISHEVMTPPLSGEGQAQLSTLSETVSYYSEIHSLLSAQAFSQSEAINFRRHRVAFADLTNGLAQHLTAKLRNYSYTATLTINDKTAFTQVLCDPDLIVYLLTELLDYELQLSDNSLVATGQESLLAFTLDGSADERFLRFTLTNGSVALSDTELHDFFMPHEGAIPLLICKQIIREHDTFLGHPGCRIQADSVGEGHRVWFTLPLALSSRKTTKP
ncbi:MAG: DUF5112 domain-containing protein [Bacteroidales bacterium]|nr:DUF5112 domain-containing protein [Bacteroidales bacterium]